MLYQSKFATESTGQDESSNQQYTQYPITTPALTKFESVASGDLVSTGPIFIGKSWDDMGALYGSLDDFRLWNYPLFQQDIEKQFMMDIKTASGLVCSLQFEGISDIGTDFSGYNHHANVSAVFEASRSEWELLTGTQRMDQHINGTSTTAQQTLASADPITVDTSTQTADTFTRPTSFVSHRVS